MISIRSANTEDLSKIRDIEIECFSDAWSEKSIEACLKSDRYILYCACKDDTVIGYVVVIKSVDFAELARIAVSKDSRGLGIGRSLLVKAKDTVYRLGFESLYLEVRSDNAPAIALYESEGAVFDGERKNYYGSGKDAKLYHFTRGEKPLGI